MSHPSSSVAPNPVLKHEVTAEQRICIAISFFWQETSEGLIATFGQFDNSFTNYFYKRWGLMAKNKDIYRNYYAGIPDMLGRGGQPLDEDMLGNFIAILTLQIGAYGAFERMTTIPIVDGLHAKAREDMTKVAENMKKDGRMEKVKGAWEKYFFQIGGIGIASFDSETFDFTSAGNVNLHADLDLND